MSRKLVPLPEGIPSSMELPSGPSRWAINWSDEPPEGATKLTDTLCPAVPSKASRPIFPALVKFTNDAVPSVAVPVTATSATVCPAGGTKRNPDDVALPSEFSTVTCPVPVLPGTVVVKDVLVEPDTAISVLPRRARSLIDCVSKCVPVTLRASPGAAIVGENPVTVGGGAFGPTVNVCVPVFVVVPTFTEIGPVVAPVGTDVMISVSVEAATVAAVPLNLTVFEDGVELIPCHR